MFEYVEELNYKITEKNYIKERLQVYSTIMNMYENLVKGLIVCIWK